MFIFVAPKQLTKVPAADLLDLPDPAPETVKESVSQQMIQETFTEFPRPSALDKMLLPASPQLDPSAAEGNFEKQKQKQLLDSSAVEGNFEKQKQNQLVDSSAVEGNFEKQQKQAIDLHKLTNLRS